MKIVSFSHYPGNEYSKAVLDWFKTNSGTNPSLNYYSGYSLYDQLDQLKGVIIYTNMTKTNIDMHWWMPGCLTKEVIKNMFVYPFVELEMKRITGIIRSTNEKVIKIVEKLGFEKEAVVKDYYNLSEDMLIYKITFEKARRWMT